MQNKKNLKNIIMIIIILITLFSLTGCSKNENDENIKNEKLDSEIQYLDTKFISLMNVLNNISFTNYKVVAEDVKEEKEGANSSGGGQSQGGESSSESGSNSQSGGSGSGNESGSGSGGGSSSSSGSGSGGGSSSKSGSSSGSSSGADSGSKNEEKNEIYSLTQNNMLSLDPNKDIKWDLIKSEVENLYSIWTTIIIDLHSAGANNEDILQFNTILDSLAKSAKEENKEQALSNLSELYNLLPKYLDSYSKDELKKNVYNTKAHLLSAYALAYSEEKWEDMNIEISKANQEFNNIINNVTIDESKKLNVNRAYLLLRETQKSIEAKDKELFFVKYKNTIQELNML